MYSILARYLLSKQFNLALNMLLVFFHHHGERECLSTVDGWNNTMYCSTTIYSIVHRLPTTRCDARQNPWYLGRYLGMYSRVGRWIGSRFQSIPWNLPIVQPNIGGVSIDGPGSSRRASP